MSILIKDMEMPTRDSMIIAIRPDGMVEDVMGCYVGEAIPVPPHGRLGDLDELLDRAFGCLDEVTFIAFQFLVNGSVTIIPAEEDNK